MAEQGDIRTRHNPGGGNSTFLLLADGSVQRQQTGERDPNIVQFDKYAFDLSQLTAGTQTTQRYSSRERYMWELSGQDPNDPSTTDRPEQMRAELHDRIAAPLYPIVIAVLTFAYLGAPRTTRQSRTVSLLSAIAAVAVLRGSGFVGLLAGARVPAALLIPYLTLSAALAFGYWGISRAVIIEPPAFIVDAIARFIERLSAHGARLTGQTR
jgi:lipopolysaccharide export system permease protein